MELTSERGARGGSLSPIEKNSVPFAIRISPSSKHELEEKLQKSSRIGGSIVVEVDAELPSVLV